MNRESEMSEARPQIQGIHGCVATSHYLATEAGFQILTQGGNAIDAAVAAGFALHVVEPHMNSIGGECPIIVHSAREHKTFAISGQGTAPRKATLAFFRENNIRLIPGDGLLPATVPGSFGAWITCLSKFGTLSLSKVMDPAIRYAEEGIVVYPALQRIIQMNSRRFSAEWPTTARVFLPNDKPPRTGDVVKQPELAKTLRALSGTNDVTAARDFFYSGLIARKIIEYASSHSIRDATGKPHTSLLTLNDFEEYKTRIEEPVSSDYSGFTVHKCGPWSQGPVFLQQLNLLEGDDLRQLGHNSVDYVHLVTEASKLAFADREVFYGDPNFSHVPLEELLSKKYARTRRRLIDMRKASMKVPRSDIQHGRIGGFCTGDTSHLDAVDADGNMVSATPSGGWIQSSPIIPGLGFPLGTRGQMFTLVEGHPNCVAPGKRPRTTLSPSLVTSKGSPVMSFGTPGGDQQDQWTLQFFLNVVEFDMDLQEAIDAPTFHNTHFPSSFYPRRASVGELRVEDRFAKSVVRGLQRRGHKVRLDGGWSHGKVTAVSFEESSKVMRAAASPRFQIASALGY
jgi:gamma-glutamyltranspeptidase/glutathione hydrolase